MANTNYNIYPLIIISEANQIVGISPASTYFPISEENFGRKITISVDGTLWALSVHPDHPGGGSRMFYSQKENEWHEIELADSGATDIAGGIGSNCFYLNNEGSICIVHTNGQVGKYFDERTVYEIGAGGGKLWAVFSPEEGDIPRLQHSNWDVPFSFTEFDTGERTSPISLSVNTLGDCYAVLNRNPVFFSHDGSTKGSAGRVADGITLGISYKGYNMIRVMDSHTNKSGNEIMQLLGNGTYAEMNFRGTKVLSTYYLG